MKKNQKYDIIIYGSLLLAFLFIGLGYFESLGETLEYSFSLKENFKEEPIKKEKDTEPEALTKEDKKSIVKKYLDSLLDRIYDDSLITYEMIKTWGNYEVLNINYERKITDNYYAYSIDIKINNLDAIVPTNKNEALSTEEYIVISLNANITYLESKNGYIVKKIDIPANN
jgi:hypothetical protein